MRKLPPMLRAISAALAALALAGCGSGGEQTEATSIVSEAAASVDTGPKPQLGLMTSLPLYWPLGVDLSDLASGDVEAPWQRAALEHNHELHDARQPLEILRTIHSFDPCIACAVHLSDEDGQEIIQVKVR